MKLTIKRRIMLLYTLLTTILLGILLPIVYVTVSASLNLDIQSRLNNAIAQVLIAVDDQDEKFVLNDQVDLPDYISMCVTDGNGNSKSRKTPSPLLLQFPPTTHCGL